MSEIEIRALRGLDDMYPAVALQRIYWGDDVESVIPAHMLFSLANYGGHVLAALDEDKLVGVLVGFLGTHMKESHRPAMANLQIVSKRMVVDPAYRSHGIGYRLKLAQRDMAKQQGIRLVTWTFDPLLATNAHLNLRKLAAICQEYVENYYGTSGAGGLATLGASDRLLVEWWVTNRRVEERLHGTRGNLSLSQYLEANAPIVNPAVRGGDGLLRPPTSLNELAGSFALVEIPLNYPEMMRQDPALAQAWRLHIRMVMQRLFAENFVVTDFLRDTYEGQDRAFYLFSFNIGFDYRLN